jgi:flagellar M-ring protein FliF
VNYQRALEGELERTIQTMSSVKSARVHLVMASDSVFVDRERGAKASVTLRLRRGSLSRDDISAISRLVAGAVDELKPTDVVIVDADSNRSLGQSNSSSDGSDGIEQELTRRLISTLSPVVGADRIHASVNVEYETGSSEESQEKYDPAVSATLTMQHSEEGSGPGAATGGVPGASSNVPGAKASVPKSITKGSGQYSMTDNNSYGVNRTTRHVIEPAGSIRRLTAAVLLDDAIERKQVNGKWTESYHKRQPEELQHISELAQAAIGFNSTRGDVISVQNLTFDRAEAEDIPPTTLLDKARKGLNDYSSEVRYAALLALFLLVYQLMIRPIQKRVLAAPNPLLAQNRIPVQTEPEAGVMLESSTNLVQRNLLLKKQLVEFVKSEPESSTTAVRAWLREETP